MLAFVPNFDTYMSITQLTPNLAQAHCRSQRMGQRPPPDPNCWAEATDADRRLVVQGQRNVKWKMIREAWQKATGLRTGLPALQLRQARLVSIIGNEAMLNSSAYIDSGEDSEGEPPPTRNAPSKYSNVRAVRKQLGFPVSWDQASKADKRLVSMKDKGHKWETIAEEFQKSIGRHMRPNTCKTRYRRLLELRDKPEPSPGVFTSKSDEKDTKAKVEPESPNLNQDSKRTNNDGGDLSDGVSVYSISDDSSEDEGPLSMIRVRRTHRNTNDDCLQLSKDFAEPQSGGQDFHTPHRDPATHPEKMLAAMRDGEKRWPKVREAWENATNEKTPANGIEKQDLAILRDDEVSAIWISDHMDRLTGVGKLTSCR